MASADEAEQFFGSLAGDMNPALPLRWSFLIGGLEQDHVGRLMEVVDRLGFTEIEPLIDEDRDGQYILWFGEVRVHTTRSFADRVAEVAQLASREQLVLLDYSAGPPE